MHHSRSSQQLQHINGFIIGIISHFPNTLIVSIASAFISMSRVSTAAAVTLQTWSRTVLAKKEASSLRSMQLRKTKSLVHSDGMSFETLSRRFLMCAAAITLVGALTQTAGGPQMLASSPVITAQDASDSPMRMISVIAGSLPSLLYSSRS